MLRRVGMLVLAITLHNIPEEPCCGVAFGALHKGFTIEALWLPLSVAVGIGLQTTRRGLPYQYRLEEGYSKRKSFLYGQASRHGGAALGLIRCRSCGEYRKALPFAWPLQPEL